MSTKIKFDEELNILTAERESDRLLEAESMGVTILRSLENLPPEKTLEHHYESGVKLTASEILEKSKLCAQNLQKHGLQQGDIMIIFSQVNEDITPLIIGCLLIGVIVSSIDSDFGTNDTSHALNILQPKAIFYDEKFFPKIKFLINTSNLKLFIPFGDAIQSVSSVLFNDGGEEFVPKDLGSNIPACILFTSGTTGNPKRVIVSHYLLRHNVFNWWTISADDILFVATQPRWINHLSLLLRPVFTGCLRIVSNSPADYLIFCEIISNLKVTQFLGGVGLISQLIAHNENTMSLKSLKAISCTGETVPQKLRIDLKNFAPNCKLISLYGMTEIAGVIAHDESLENKSTNSGYLLPGFQIKVVDHEYNSLNAGRCGVLFLKFQEGFLRYFQDDKNSNQRFTEDGWYNTEDYGRIHEKGVIEVFGRCSDNILCDGNLVGFHIDYEFEQVLINSFPDHSIFS